MKRLTEKHYHGVDHYLLCSADCHLDMDCVDCPAFDEVVERLAAYEDTGMEPEEVENSKRQRWIPCSERLPEAGKPVLTTDGGFVGEMYINKRGKWQRYNANSHSTMMALDILFWMPLPEPPEEGGSEG